MSVPPRPSEFSRGLMAALDASDGRRRKRKRDTRADAIGLEIKRDLLEQTTTEDPAPEAFEGWLLARALAAPASGPVLALCAEVLDEYRLACADPTFAGWLAAGAPSEDTDHATRLE